MSGLLCCLCARAADMGAALSHAGTQDVEACDGVVQPVAPPTMADVIRERKKKAGGAGLGTLRRRIAAATRRTRDSRPDRGCEHARFIRSVVSSWRLAEVFLLCEELEAGAALRDLGTQAELARRPAAHLARDLHRALRRRWWCDVELVGAGYSLPAHRAVLCARCSYFRELLQHYPRTMYRVPLEGAASNLNRHEMEAVIAAIYCGEAAQSCCEHERVDDDLDIINVEGNNCRRNNTCACAASRVDAAALRRLGSQLGFTPDTLHRDMRYLLDSGSMSDARLVFSVEGGSGPQYGFRAAHEQPCHRLVLAARSRFFRSVMSRRGGAAGGAASGAASGACGVRVDEAVLPRRFARALLHAAYTDQVDLSLVGRNSSSPSSTTSSGSGTTPWSSVTRGRATGSAMLEDAFQLYEIARFVEMPIVVQGCEDAIVEALCPETLPSILRWSSQGHASQWVHRQAMRYLRDEFVTIMSHSASSRLPVAAVSEALSSPFLQAAEPQAARALLRWAERAAQPNREPNVVWHTGHRGRRREVSSAALRDALAPLIPLLRMEHIPAQHEIRTQLARRGVAPPPAEPCGAAWAWRARGSLRPPRCFMPYLDELRALLEEQAVPEAELARARRAKNMHRIPDTLYMVSSRPARPPSPAARSPGAGACVPARARAALRARAAELRGTPAAQRALRLHSHDTAPVRTQIALRAVREMGLPDSCAELLMNEAEFDDGAPERDGSASHESRSSGDWQYDRDGRERERDRRWGSHDCCSMAGGAAHAHSTGSLRGDAAGRRRDLLIHADTSRPGTCRRETQRGTVEPPSPCAGAARLSAAVPDVAMAPNANTHLLTAPAHFSRTEYSGVLQLDLGDGATHTPRPGSRAARALAALRPLPAEHADLAAVQAYSSLRTPQLLSIPPGRVPSLRRTHDSLPPAYRDISHSAALSRAASPAALGARAAHTFSLSRVGNNPRPGSRSPSPAHNNSRALPQRRHDYRPETGYGSPAGGSRSHSPRD